MKVLFICKKHEVYGQLGYSHKSSGLFNSTEMIAHSLRNNGIFARVVVVTDNNDIDREVSSFRPDICIIEALWVIPDKFDVLKKLHPCVEWFIHLHSNIPFLASEGIAIEWLMGYEQRAIGIIANSEASYENLKILIDPHLLTYLPNVYFGRAFNRPKQYDCEADTLNVGCFGAIRPMKNQLLQAFAAIQCARSLDKALRFHVNAGRVELGGESVLKNLRALLGPALIEHPWHGARDFLSYLHQNIDIGLQVSLSETFNIVTADYVAAGLPVVVSPEVSWISCLSQSGSAEAGDIADRMEYVIDKRSLTRWNQHLLKKHSSKAANMWLEFCREF